MAEIHDVDRNCRPKGAEQQKTRGQTERIAQTVRELLRPDARIRGMAHHSQINPEYDPWKWVCASIVVVPHFCGADSDLFVSARALDGQGYSPPEFGEEVLAFHPALYVDD